MATGALLPSSSSSWEARAWPVVTPLQPGTPLAAAVSRGAQEGSRGLSVGVEAKEHVFLEKRGWTSFVLFLRW